MAAGPAFRRLVALLLLLIFGIQTVALSQTWFATKAVPGIVSVRFLVFGAVIESSTGGVVVHYLQSSGESGLADQVLNVAETDCQVRGVECDNAIARGARLQFPGHVAQLVVQSKIILYFVTLLLVITARDSLVARWILTAANLVVFVLVCVYWNRWFNDMALGAIMDIGAMGILLASTVVWTIVYFHRVS